MKQGKGKKNAKKTTAADLSQRVDARILRTRELLRMTILELSGETEVSQISITTIARVAGINRSTFYQHASSPEALLSDVLSYELASIRQVHIPIIIQNPTKLRRLVRIGMSFVVDYLLSREATFRRHMYCSLPSMHNILAKQIEEATLDLFHSDVLEPLSGDSEVWPIAAAYHAHGVAAALLKWLDQDGHRDRGQLEDLLEASLPNWFPVTE